MKIRSILLLPFMLLTSAVLLAAEQTITLSAVSYTHLTLPTILLV